MAVPTINTSKLRRLIIERQRLGIDVRRITDQYLELRQEIARLEYRVERSKDSKPEPHPQDEQRLADLREQADELARARDVATQRFEDFGFVDELVEHARHIGYYVNVETASITKIVRDDRAQVPEGALGGAGQKSTFVPDTVGAPARDAEGESPSSVAAETGYSGEAGDAGDAGGASEQAAAASRPSPGPRRAPARGRRR